MNTTETSTSGATKLLVADGVCKTYGTTEVLKQVSVSVERGTTTCIIGPSGSGKSTLLRCLAYLEVPTSGAVYLGDDRLGVERDVSGKLREMRPRALARQRLLMGMIFQQFNLFPHLTVRENCTLAPIKVRGETASVANTFAMEQLRLVGMADFADRRPVDLSGGQQQRAAIARALCMRPEVLLFDEPTSALDPELVGEVLKVMQVLALEGTSMVVVTHEMQFAAEMADQVIFMDGGCVVETGSAADVLRNPAHPRTREFLRRVV